MNRLKLVATKVAPAGMAQGRVPDFAGALPRAELNDPGRAWAGDLYDTGAPTNPEEAFAQFRDQSGIIAWLDKQPDGTLIGWVQDGNQTWRYTDPRTWATDVDADQMQRTDAPGGDTLGMPGEVEDDTQMPANQTSTDFGPDVPDEKNPFLNDDSPDLNEIVGELSDADLEAQAAQDGESPLENNTGEGTDPAGVTPGEEGQPAQVDTEEQAADAAPVEDPDPAAPDAPPAADPDAAGEATEPAAYEEDDDEDKNPFAKEKKHHPGGHEHNQQDHGDWADALPGGHFPSSSPNSRESRDGGSAGSADPKAGKPGGGDGEKPTRPKVKVDQDSIDRMGAAELEALWRGDKIYDHDTLMAVAKRLDELDDLGEGLKDLPKDPDERQVWYRGAVPEHYVSWVASAAAKPKKQNKKATQEDAYFDHIYAQFLRAEKESRGNLWSKRGAAYARKQGWDVMALFDGRVKRNQIKMYATEELQRFFANDPRLTLAEFVAEQTNSAYMTEHG